jgi:hypothetical protein
MKLSQLSDDSPTRIAEEFCSSIQDMLDEGRWHWAEDTLLGIHETVSRTGTVTDGQRRAVENIRFVPSRGR